MPARITQENFIKRSSEIHNNKYDYSLVRYYNGNSILDIICPKHGIFHQKGSIHLQLKNGCPKCAGRSWVKDDFLKEANILYEEIYDYSKVIFKGKMGKIIIGCTIHGDFETTPNMFLTRNVGCPRCGGTGKLTTLEFTDRSSIIHDNKYDYSKSIYISSGIEIIIICPIHGEFNQTPPFPYVIKMWLSKMLW